MEVAAKIYTSIVFPDTLSKTDPHLSDLQKTMLDATPDCIKVLSVDGRLLAMNRRGMSTTCIFSLEASTPLIA